MAGHTGELADLRLHLDGLAEQLDRGGPLDEGDVYKRQEYSLNAALKASVSCALK